MVLTTQWTSGRKTINKCGTTILLLRRFQFAVLNDGLIPGYMQLIKMATYKRTTVKVLGDILLMYNFISDVQ